MSKTNIEWADRVWNPVTGCRAISEGCRNCYAKEFAIRMRGKFGYPHDYPFRPGVIHNDQFDEPLKWKKAQKIFVCSMGDLFHEGINVFEEENHYSITGNKNYLNKIFVKIFDVIKTCEQHTFFMLTKRPKLAKDIFDEVKKIMPLPLANLWVGVSTETQETADERIPMLLDIPAIRHFVSVEPMLETVNLERYLEGEKSLDWIICGAETGRNAREMNDAWAKNLFEQCNRFKKPFFFKKTSNGSDRFIINADGMRQFCRNFPNFRKELFD